LYGHEPVGQHRVREVKRLVLYAPPSQSDLGGPRGAAQEAFTAWMMHQKQALLQRCLAWVEAQPQAMTFTARDVKNQALTQGDQSLVRDAEIEAMLSRQSSVRGLTRTPEGAFSKVRG
jgi:hypothetical protein